MRSFLTEHYATAARIALRNRLAVILAGAALAGCAIQPAQTSRVVRYDLGAPASESLAATAPTRSAAALPLVKVLQVTAPTALDSDQIRYRLSYADPLESRSYGGSRWTATPAQLLTDRLRGALASHARLLDGGDPEHAPLLKVELIDFSQHFDAPGESRGVVVVRASLKVEGRLLAQRDFGAAVPGGSADAAGGATALARAADQVVGDVGNWVGTWLTSSSNPAVTTPARAN